MNAKEHTWLQKMTLCYVGTSGKYLDLCLEQELAMEEQGNYVCALRFGRGY